METLPIEPTAEQDFYAWSSNQWAHLQSNSLEALDVHGISKMFERFWYKEREDFKKLVTRIFYITLMKEYTNVKWARSQELLELELIKLKPMYMKSPSLATRDYFQDAYFTAYMQVIESNHMPINNFPETVPKKLVDLVTHV